MGSNPGRCGEVYIIQDGGTESIFDEEHAYSDIWFLILCQGNLISRKCDDRLRIIYVEEALSSLDRATKNLGMGNVPVKHGDEYPMLVEPETWVGQEEPMAVFTESYVDLMSVEACVKNYGQSGMDRRIIWTV